MKKIIIILLILCIAYGAFIYFRNNKDTSNHYINSIYKSDERIYKNELSKDDQKMYDLLIDKSVKHQDKFTINMEDYNCVDYSDCGDVLRHAHEALTVDHPELMNYAGYSWKYANNTFSIRLYPSYNLSFKDYYGEYKINKILDKIEKETKDMTDREKILYVYNWMGDNNKYDYYFTYTSKNQSVYNVFVKKNAVCAGFAKASQIIFQRIGINSYIVSGTTDSDYHMWNIIEYNDKYYYFDSTVAVGYKKGSDNYYNGIKYDKMTDYTITFYKWYPNVEETNIFDI